METNAVTIREATRRLLPILLIVFDIKIKIYSIVSNYNRAEIPHASGRATDSRYTLSIL